MSAPRRSQRKTIDPSKRKKYLKCIENAQKITTTESQNERLEMLGSILEKYLLLSSTDQIEDGPSSSNSDEKLPSMDESYLRAVVSKTSTKAVNQVVTDFNVVPSEFNLHDYAAKLQPAPGERFYDWEKLEVFSEAMIRPAPHFSSFWVGINLSEEMKQPIVKKRCLTRKKDDAEPAKKIVPNNVQNAERKDGEEYRQLHKSLRHKFESHGKKPVNFFKLVVDEGSYPATVENMFNFAFLIRENMARLIVGDDGMPLAEPISTKESQRLPSDREEDGTEQMIISFTFEKWKNLVEHLL